MNTGEVIALAKAFGGGGGSSGGGVLVVNATAPNYVCDKTAGEMLTAFSKGPIIIRSSDGNFYEAVLNGLVEGTSYTFTTLENEYKASSAEGYPSVY